MSYTVKRDQNTGEAMKDWFPHVVMPFEKNELPLRLQQLKVRNRECQTALDLLIKINDGASIEHLLLSTVNLNQFKVRNYFFKRKHKSLISYSMSTLQGLMDLRKPIIAGHSFGGATTLRTLEKDKRFKYIFTIIFFLFLE